MSSADIFKVLSGHDWDQHDFSLIKGKLDRLGDENKSQIVKMIRKKSPRKPKCSLALALY